MKGDKQNMLVREIVGPYHVVELEGSRFLAVPAAVDGRSLEELESSDGAVFGESLEDIKEKIGDIRNWANSRGQLEKSDASQGAVFMRANSFAVAREQIKGRLLAGNTVQARDGKSYIIHDPHERKEKNNWVQLLGDVGFFGKALIRAGFRFLRSRNLNAVRTSFDEGQIKVLKRILMKGSAGNRALSLTTTSYRTFIWIAVLGLWREFLGTIKIKKTVEIGGDNWPTMVLGRACEPEMIFSGKDENVVKLDQYYFVVPHGVPVDWTDLDVLGRFPHSPSLKTLYENLDKNFASSRPLSGDGGKSNELLAMHSRPEVVKELVEYDYRIVLFEGWYIGVPRRLYDVDLTKRDILSESGVIRDVALEVVELEIAEAAEAV